MELPTKKCKNLFVVCIPQSVFGKRVTVQAHKISKTKRGKDICDGHGCDQVDAKGDIKFFTRIVDISGLGKND